MSRAWTWRQAILKTPLPATTKHVLLVISCHMNDMGDGCYPSTKLLAERSSLSERSVCTHIEEAERAGWLKVERHGFAGQKWARHDYSPAWPEGTETGASPEKGTEPDDAKALNLLPKGTEPRAAYIDNIPVNIPIEHSSTPISPKPTKASSRADPVRSIAVLLEDLAAIPAAELEHAISIHGFDAPSAQEQWARFRNHHISTRSKHYDIGKTWDNWCRRTSLRERTRATTAGGTTGQGGFKRHDHVAAAVDKAMVDLYGVHYTGHGGQAAQPADEACPFGDGPEAIDAVFVDVGAGNAARQITTGSADGGDTDSAGGSALSLEVQRG